MSKKVSAINASALTPEMVIQEAMEDKDFKNVKHVIVFGFEESGAAIMWASQMSVAMWALAVMSMQSYAYQEYHEVYGETERDDD